MQQPSTSNEQNENEQQQIDKNMGYPIRFVGTLHDGASDIETT